ncbi:MAG: alpha/beta hydrolase [Flavobacteriaceae bacterium]|nr:MAG: alpha/beta hydrolase [Flavobacteriaceae bacterium]
MTTNENTKYTDANSVPKPILFIARFLQFISPSLATKFAVYLFKKPIRYKTPKHELGMDTQSKQETVHIKSLKKDIRVYSYGKATKKILLVHGWSGRGTQLVSIADALLEQGYMTISFDAPAHGKSAAKTTMMPEFVSCIHQLEKDFGPFEAAIGHSLGAMALLSAVKEGFPIKKLVILGAGDSINDIIHMFIEKMKLKPVIGTRMKRVFFDILNFDIENYSGNISAKDVKIPTLVFHDENDLDVPVSSSKNIRQNLQDSELIITQNLGHRRILKDEKVIAKILDYLRQ